jgi:hypothetical protein
MFSCGRFFPKNSISFLILPLRSVWWDQNNIQCQACYSTSYSRVSYTIPHEFGDSWGLSDLSGQNSSVLGSTWVLGTMTSDPLFPCWCSSVGTLSWLPGFSDAHSRILLPDYPPAVLQELAGTIQAHLICFAFLRNYYISLPDSQCLKNLSTSCCSCPCLG